MSIHWVLTVEELIHMIHSNQSENSFFAIMHCEYYRLFALGRTDNMNPLSDESIRWVLTMEDSAASREEKIKALRAAIGFLSK